MIFPTLLQIPIFQFCPVVAMLHRHVPKFDGVKAGIPQSLNLTHHVFVAICAQLSVLTHASVPLMPVGFRQVLQNPLHGRSAISETVIQGKTRAWLKNHKQIEKPLSPYRLIITKIGVNFSVFVL